MESEDQTRTAINIIVFVVFLAVVYFILSYFGVIDLIEKKINFGSEPEAQKPYQLIRPEKGFATGTTVSLYKTTPPGFPAEVILENKPIYHSSTVSMPDGNKQIVVSYLSDGSPEDTANFYMQNLPKKNWVLQNTKITKNVSVIDTSFGNEKVLITITPGVGKNAEGSLVTFQYKQTGI